MRLSLETHSCVVPKVSCEVTPGRHRFVTVWDGKAYSVWIDGAIRGYTRLAKEFHFSSKQVEIS